MAELTENIGNPELRPLHGPVEVKNPGGPGESVVQGGANLGAGLLRGFMSYAEGVSQNNKTEAANQVALAGWQYDKSDFARARSDETPGAPQSEVAPDPAPAVVTDSINKTIQIASSAQTGVGQGRVSQDQADLVLENSLDTLFSKHPDQAAAIYEAMDRFGLSHKLSRLSDLEAKQVAYQQTNQLAIEDDWIKKAATSGIDVTSMPRDAAAKAGRDIEHSEFLMDQAAKTQAYVKANLDIDETRRKQLTDDVLKGTVAAAQSKFTAVYEPFIDHFASLAEAAGSSDDPAAKAAFQHAAATALPVLESFRTNAHASIAANGGGKPEWDQVDSMVDAAEKHVQELSSGPLSDFESQKRTLDVFKTSVGVNAAQALPVYSGLKEALGRDVMAAYFPATGLPPLDPKVLQAVKGELQGFKPGTADGTLTLYHVADMIKGEVGLMDMKPADAIRALPNLITATNAKAQTINSGADRSLPAYQGFANGYMNILSADHSLQPGSAHLADLISATYATSGKGVREAVYGMSANADTQRDGAVLVQESRAAAAKLLVTMQNYKSKPDEANNQTDVAFNTKTGQYEAKLTLRDPRASIDSPVAYRAATNPTTDPMMVKKAGAMNMLLQHLTESRQTDASIPKDATDLSIRAHYATGAPYKDASGAVIQPPAAAAKGPDVKTQALQFEAEGHNLTTQTQAGTQDTRTTSDNQAKYEPKAREYAASAGISERGFAAVIGHESSWDPQADAHKHFPNSHAEGLAQFEPHDGEAYGLHSREDRMNPDKALPAGAKYLQDLHTKYGTWEQALYHYTGGDWKARDIKRVAQMFEDDEVTSHRKP